MTLLVYQKFNSIAANIHTMPTEGKSQLQLFREAHLQATWIAEALTIFFLIAAGLTFIYFARKLMGDGHLKCCCIFEGIVSALAFCSVCGYCFYFFLIVAGSSALDATFICDNANVTNRTAYLTASLETPDWGIQSPEQNCVTAINVVHSMLQLIAVYLFFAGLTQCALGVFCGVGAKYANDAQEAFDDENEEGMPLEVEGREFSQN